MVLYDSDFSYIELDKAKNIVKHVWKESSRGISDEQFRREMEKLAAVFEQYMPDYVLVDQRQFYYVVVPSMQVWVDENVNRILVENKCKKIAFVVPPELLAKLSVSQTLQERYSQNLNVHFFDEYDQAVNWLGV